MFHKLVSNLPYSPALVGQLGFYARRLRKEEVTRKFGLVFTALALIVQSFAVFQPPEAANAASASDFIRGGISSREEFLQHYDANTNNIQDLFNYIGINRGNISATSVGNVNSKGNYSWGMTSRFSAAQGEQVYNIRTGGGGTRAFYERPLWAWDTGANVSRGSNYKALIGTSSTGEPFAILFNCGNLVLNRYPPPPVCEPGTIGTYPNCTPRCPVKGKEHLAANDPGCKEDPIVVCDALKITKLIDKYQFDAYARALNGAAITGYNYTVKRNGNVVNQERVKSTKGTDTYLYSQTQEGSYTVELTVDSSLGTKTSPNCSKTFNVTPPPICPLNPKLPKDDPECQPCPGDPTLWIKDEKCSPEIIQTKTAVNKTQNGVDATKTTAKAADTIAYTLTLQNIGKQQADIAPTELLDDVTEYASIKDFGGGVYNESNHTLTWKNITLKPGEKQTHVFAVQLAATIPATGTGVSDPGSYDCKMTNTFGNTVDIPVDCPYEKAVVEQVVSELPTTGPTENMIFAAILMSVVVYFYARARQTGKEIRLIRKNLHSGAL